MSKTLAELRQSRSALNGEAETLLAKATAENRDVTEAEDGRLKAITAELVGIETERAALEDSLSTPEQVATAVAEASKAATTRAADIAAACELAGKPAKAHGFIVSGKSLDAVTADLKAAAAAADDLNPRNPRSAAKPDTAAAWGNVIDKVNARVSSPGR